MPSKFSSVTDQVGKGNKSSGWNISQCALNFNSGKFAVWQAKKMPCDGMASGWREKTGSVQIKRDVFWRDSESVFGFAVFSAGLWVVVAPGRAKLVCERFFQFGIILFKKSLGIV